MRFDGELEQILLEEIPLQRQMRLEEYQTLSKLELGTLALPTYESLIEVGDLRLAGDRYLIYFNPNRKRVKIYDSDSKPVGLGNQINFCQEDCFVNDAWFYA